MNKKLFLKLGVLLLSLSFVGCGQENNLAGKDNSSKSSAIQSVSGTQSLGKESIKTTYPSDEKAVKSKPDDEDIQPYTQQEATEEEYYDLIKKAWQKQEDYINSIDDPKEKQSVQTAHSAAIFKSNELLLAHPEDSEAINESLKKVLDGE